MSLQYSFSNPFRPPDWRWQRAREIREGRGLCSTNRRDGTLGRKWINEARRFLRAFHACDNEVEMARLADNKHGIFWAYWIWQSDNDQKYSIEAHILARDNDFEIAYRCGVTPSVIEAYEALFFNVRDKLLHTKYIVNVVMGSAIHRGLSEREYDLLWKLYGYFSGPHVLDAIENKFSGLNWCNDPNSVGAAMFDDAVSTLKTKAALAAKTVAVNQHTQLALMERFTQFVEVERNTDSQGKAQEQILDHIQAMLTSLPFNVGGRDPRNHNLLIDRGPLDEYETSAIELTYEETMRVCLRRPIANAETLKALSFPEGPHTLQLEDQS